jgi:prepilin-type N-terminal cleavage/methylation domain-containing protein
MTYRKLNNIGAGSGGFTLLELLIVISIMATMSVLYFETQTVQFQDDMAKVTSQRFVQYNNAVTAYIFDNYNDLAAQAEGAGASPGVVTLGATVTGTDWLKEAAGCGGGALANKGYLPCGFPDDPGFQLQFESTITLCPLVLGAAPNNWCTSPQPPLVLNQRYVFHGYTTLEPAGAVPAGCNGRDLCLNAEDRLDLSSQIIALARANNGPVGFDGYSNLANYDYLNPITSPPPAGGNVMIAHTSNTASNDPWLRTDGTNYMQADLHMGGVDGVGVYNEYDIVNTRHLSASGNLYLDANQDETGVATLNSGNIYNSGHINTGIVTTNTLGAIDNIVSAVASVNGDIHATNNLAAMGNATFGDTTAETNGNITAMGNIDLGTAANGQGDITAFGDAFLGDPATGNGGDFVALGDATFGYYGAGTTAGDETAGAHVSGGKVLVRDSYIDQVETLASAGTYWTSIVDNGSIVSKAPIAGMTCNAAEGLTSRLYLAPVMYSRDNAGGPIGAVQTWADDNGGTWTARMRILTPSGWFEPSGTYGKLQAIVKCG